MSGRKRNGAFASTVTTMLMDDRKRRMDNADEDTRDRREFQQRLVEAGIKSEIEKGNIGLRGEYASQLQGQRDAAAGERQQAQQGFTAQQNDLNRQSQMQGAMLRNPGYDPNLDALGLSGAFERKPPQPMFDPSNLQAGQSYSQNVGGGRLTTQGPPAPKQVDPATRANQIAQLQARLQGIEQKNQLAPMLAEQSRMTTYPNEGIIGGYQDQPVDWFDRLRGVKQRPAATPIQQTDTTFIRSQLDALMGQQPKQVTQDSSISGNQDSFRADIQAAIQAIQAGKDPQAVKQRLLQAYPNRQYEIQSIGLN